MTESRGSIDSLLAVAVKSSVTHTVTYFTLGVLAFTLLDYESFFAENGLAAMMRPTDDRWVMAGPLFQPIRGFLFGGVFYLLRKPLFGSKDGWLVMWLVLVVFGIVGTFGPAPGSMEGMIFTVFPLSVHLRGLPETVLQSLALSVVLCYWVRHSDRRWLDWVMGAAFVILITLTTLGLLTS